jgi:predicted porin
VINITLTGRLGPALAAVAAALAVALATGAVALGRAVVAADDVGGALDRALEESHAPSEISNAVQPMSHRVRTRVTYTTSSDQARLSGPLAS